ncbi:MAG: hypothetical protein GY760_03655 [Deltaproteobacteria bacterium]|nr:hypothetical protein [Deltaproteobacteria bacterium]
MSIQINLEDIYHAYSCKDPALSSMIVNLSSQWNNPETPVREGAPTFEGFIETINSRSFLKKPLEDQATYRIEQMKLLESESAEVPLSDRLKLHEVIMELWQDKDVFARNTLLEVIADVNLTYGPFRALKNIFKEAEESIDTEIYGALCARFDMALSKQHSISKKTLGYLVRRGWRFLRRTGETFPVMYADYTTDVLACYTDVGYTSWIANHIFFHQTRKYSRRRFTPQRYNADILKNRAFPDLWKRSMRPLLSLLERAKADKVRQFAMEALKADFKTEIREIDPLWIKKFIKVQEAEVHEFVLWIFENVPKLEQASFKDLDLHDTVLTLFHSSSDKACEFAVSYAKRYARDLPVKELIKMMNNSNKKVRELASLLIKEYDPRKDIGLDAWGELLETENGHDFAAEMIRKHFGASELTKEWLKERLKTKITFKFAESTIVELYKLDQLGIDFFIDIIETSDKVSSNIRYNNFNFAKNNIEKFDINKIEPSFFKRLLLSPSKNTATEWIENGKLKCETIGLDFFKALAYQPMFDENNFIEEVKSSDLGWANRVMYENDFAETIFNLLSDERLFKPKDLGFEWLMELVQRKEPEYFTFASDVMIKNFTPSDFVGGTEKEKDVKVPDKVTVDLKKQSFLFTGKMATLVRKDAQNKVKEAGGKISSSVNKSLSYLVIGDEGSPLYEEGKKGSKQLKAESFISDGVDLKIISETSFINMISGKEVSAGNNIEGCEKLFESITTKGESQLKNFAIKYFKLHHRDICLAETDRPVDMEAEIPEEFLSFERIMPLFFHDLDKVRVFALDLAKWEFARWAPAKELVDLSEAEDKKVARFVGKSLFAEDHPENRTFRLDPKSLPTSVSYRFCESFDSTTRDIGIKLISENSEFQIAEELFRLTESSDRKLRSFAIRTLWFLYKGRDISSSYKNSLEEDKIVFPEKPGNRPSEDGSLRSLLGRILFELPGTKLDKESKKGVNVKPLPTRKAKLSLIEVIRDFAVEDKDFAIEVSPLLTKFTRSLGVSEKAACLVAITRIHQAHPDLI